MSSHAILTPYLIPPSLPWKTMNLGDGFILRGIERLLGSFDPRLIFSPRVQPGEAEQAAMASAPAVLLGGANQLHDNYRIWPGLTPEKLRQAPFVFVPIGVGIHGEAGHTINMSPETRAILEIVHERIEYSSWRCPRTVRYLEASLPHLKGRFMMTGCPVAYDTPVLESKEMIDRHRVVAVTATERGDFWEREIAILEFVAKEFPRARKLLVVHQNFKPPARFEALRHRLRAADPNEDQIIHFRCVARKMGYRIVFPSSADEALRLYQSVDIHFGSRLHAHLHMLSRNKRSILVAIDDRARGMGEAFDFPLLEPNELSRWDTIDFGKIRAAIQRNFVQMERFAKSLS